MQDLQIFDHATGCYVHRASTRVDMPADKLMSYARDTLGSRCHRVLNADREPPLPLRFKVPAWQRTPKRTRVTAPSPEDIARRAADHYRALAASRPGESIAVHTWGPSSIPGHNTARRYNAALHSMLTCYDWPLWITLDPTAPGAAFGPDDGGTLDAT